MSNDPNQIPTVKYGGESSPPIQTDPVAASPATSQPQPAEGKLWRPGYEYDPYNSPGERAEGMFIGVLVGKFTGETDGFCSTYREWHIFVQGLYAGFRAPQLGAVPECPPLWEDESQYFEGAAMIANVGKIYGTSTLATLAGAVVALKGSGIV